MKLIRLFAALLALGVCLTAAGAVGVLLTIGSEQYPYRGFIDSVEFVVVGTLLSIVSLVAYAVLRHRRTKRLSKMRKSTAKKYKRVGVAIVRERYHIPELREAVARRRYEKDREQQSEEDPQDCQRRPPRLRHLHVVRRGDSRR